MEFSGENLRKVPKRRKRSRILDERHFHEPDTAEPPLPAMDEHDLSFEFLSVETRLWVSEKVFTHIGRQELEGIGSRMFEKALPFWKGRKIGWLEDNRTLVLPPVPQAQRELAERVLRKRIRQTYEGK